MNHHELHFSFLVLIMWQCTAYKTNCFSELSTAQELKFLHSFAEFKLCNKICSNIHMTQWIRTFSIVWTQIATLNEQTCNNQYSTRFQWNINILSNMLNLNQISIRHYAVQVSHVRSTAWKYKCNNQYSTRFQWNINILSNMLNLNQISLRHYAVEVSHIRSTAWKYKCNNQYSTRFQWNINILTNMINLYQISIRHYAVEFSHDRSTASSQIDTVIIMSQ